MPGLQYLPRVFDAFVADETGELCVAEIDGAIVGCGKFTLVPDGSAWLETLRVIPAYQGLGVGKRLYERFFELAERTGSPTLRMYTGLSNVVSKGLAERFGLRLAGTYRGAWQACGPAAAPLTLPAFHQITDPDTATALLMPFYDKWAGFLVMNRTFYALTPALCADLAQKGMVYAEPASHSVITLGARFMPEQALHLGVFGGDVAACLAFALQTGVERHVARLSCYVPPSAQDVQETLLHHGFQIETSDLIVMEAKL
ncbi:MAG: GNAT family N-acetyltransferase [Caldilineaceae bacterium]|nr:GNAT family N-acetyltransferase [Caldilineaceae bacterium]MBP8108698.1 GNAT family N-acetyltransferase [Caldilineaceae bacterium]MBP8121047.1 GNAT family N-acetyltransferase [Caldilineaceae bacterium]MBP9073799.1 GNAT family N-acetyltransferase [Caldilineaceae bacterium]